VNGHSEKVSFIWSVADLLRGDYKASNYGKVILPFTVLRRLDCLLEPTKKAVLAQLPDACRANSCLGSAPANHEPMRLTGRILK
jgi:type I restriction-modification system DNA methylase subunit